MASQITPAVLSRAQSALTTTLAEDSKTSDIHQVFTAVPGKPGEVPESVPVEVLPVPKDAAFCCVIAVTTLLMVVLGYGGTIAISTVFATINMIGGSCGQDTWVMEAQPACRAMIRNSLAFGMELRCFDEKPGAMLQADFDQVCGINANIGVIITICIVIPGIIYAIYNNVGNVLQQQVSFHPGLFAVESWNGKVFQCSFFADVTSAKVTSMSGLVIATKAKVKVNVGCHADDKDKKGKFMQVNGDSTIEVICGHGARREEFLKEFAKYLPVNIEGFSGAVQAAGDARIKRDATFLEGKLKQILLARGSDSGNKTTFDAVRKPVSCDFFGDIMICMVICTLVIYAVAEMGHAIGWGMKRGANECIDPLRPGIDLCEFWRLFVPFTLPLITPTDWIMLSAFIVGPIGCALYQFNKLPIENRFHSNGVLQQVHFAEWSSLSNMMVFADDVQAMSVVEGCEKYVKLTVKAVFKIKEGLGKPFQIKACFAEQDLKLGLIDKSMASCSGHGQAAEQHKEKMLHLVDKFAPGKMEGHGSQA